MKSIDVSILASALSKAKPVESVTIMEQGINPYLLDRVLLPYLRGAGVFLDTLDFSQFSPEDVENARFSVCELSLTAGKVQRMADTFRNIEPSAVKRKAFC